jgi:hypothetical protein
MAKRFKHAVFPSMKSLLHGILPDGDVFSNPNVLIIFPSFETG